MSWDSISKEVGKKIFTLRKQREMSRDELAVRINISHQQLFKYEIGLNRITIDRLFAIANVLGFSVYEFLTDVDDSLITDNELSSQFSRLRTITNEELVNKFVKLLTE